MTYTDNIYEATGGFDKMSGLRVTLVSKLKCERDVDFWICFDEEANYRICCEDDLVDLYIL